MSAGDREEWSRALRATVVGGAVGLAVLLVVFVLVVLPLLIVPPSLGLTARDSIDLRNGVRTAGVAALVAIGGLGTVAYTARTYSLGRRTYGLTRTGQIADRYTRSIEQVGAATASVRLGGIHSLHQITKEETAYVEVVVDVLSAFARDRSPWPEVSSPRMAGPRRAGRDRRRAPLPAQDVVAAVNVLKNIRAHHKGPPLILRGTNLSRLDLSGCDLVRADLSGANLSATKLNAADLEGADLRKTAGDPELYQCNLRWVRATIGSLSPEITKDAIGRDTIQWSA